MMLLGVGSPWATSSFYARLFLRSVAFSMEMRLSWMRAPSRSVVFHFYMPASVFGTVFQDDVPVQRPEGVGRVHAELDVRVEPAAGGQVLLDEQGVERRPGGDLAELVPEGEHAAAAYPLVGPLAVGGEDGAGVDQAVAFDDDVQAVGHLMVVEAPVFGFNGCHVVQKLLFSFLDGW